MLKARGAPIAVLPQALGPFERPDMRQAARDLFSLADLIFARDSDSHGFVRSLDLGPGVALRQAPDITHLLQGDVPPDAAAWSDAVCIVPNTRMLDKTGPERSAAYLDFLQDAVAATRAHGLRPVVVLHEANDGDTIGRLNDRLEAPVEVVDEDAVRTKGIFASCHAVVASRYHALVSCLSQATPCIGTSWSHKYDRLFEEYDHSDFLLIPEGDPIERRARLDALLDPEGRAAIAARLAPHARAQKDKVAGMWSEIDDLLGIDHVRAEGGG
jgi:colanic acid/amylovoran biosynthesis protein